MLARGMHWSPSELLQMTGPELVRWHETFEQVIKSAETP